MEGWEEANPRDLESHWVSWPALASPSVPPIVSPSGETWEAAIYRILLQVGSSPPRLLGQLAPGIGFQHFTDENKSASLLPCMALGTSAAWRVFPDFL